MCRITCCSCGIPFSIPDDTDNDLRKTYRIFYCPAGHGQSYVKPELPKPKPPTVIYRDREIVKNETVVDHNHVFSRGKKPQCKICGLFKHMLKETV